MLKEDFKIRRLASAFRKAVVGIWGWIFKALLIS